MNSKARLWQFLMDKKKATNAEIANFMRGSAGQLSWGQRLREIRKELQARGGELKCVQEKIGIYSYTVILPSDNKNA